MLAVVMQQEPMFTLAEVYSAAQYRRLTVGNLQSFSLLIFRLLNDDIAIEAIKCAHL